MLTQNLGYPRIGGHRELKKACENYWAGKIELKDLLATGITIRRDNWLAQKVAGIDLIPSNDFSYYDQVLDHSMMFGAIPQRYNDIILKKGNDELDLYFAMARGYQKDHLDVMAMEMTKWFDTNYHYIVPEFHKGQEFKLFSTKIIDEFYEAKKLGVLTKPVLIGPVSYLLLGKEKETGFNRIELIKNLLPVYFDILTRLKSFGAEWVQLDEPFLALDLTENQKQVYKDTYKQLRTAFPDLKFIVATYFDRLGDNTRLATSLPVDVLHIDLVRAPQQLEQVLGYMPEKLILSLGVVDGRNIWKNDYSKSIFQIKKAIDVLGLARVIIAPSCSLVHTPVDLDIETVIDPEIKNWMAFAKQKLNEVKELRDIFEGDINLLQNNIEVISARDLSVLIHKQEVKNKTATITKADASRRSEFVIRQKVQQQNFNFPLFPTTTIGSFPQTDEIRQLRSKFKSGKISQEEYDSQIEIATISAIRWQEEIGLDVLVHGEFERNDMVEYFGELLDGFLFTKNGWVQSYGSRCVKPPVIYGDISRRANMTVRWSSFAQANTAKIMKGMLTGPVTILQWSFVRDDQPRSETTFQIALAIRDEVVALEQAGIKIIQIDEPAIREGLPLRKSDWAMYLDWAVKAFRIAASGVRDETQIHTHMCYSEFNDIIEHIAAMDADVITIETSRSQMELLSAFADFKYPNEIGPGVYDIHSPRIPTIAEMAGLLEKAAVLLPAGNIWVNPDCGLKTRNWPETKEALINMVKAAELTRQKISVIL